MSRLHMELNMNTREVDVVTLAYRDCFSSRWFNMFLRIEVLKFAGKLFIHVI